MIRYKTESGSTFDVRLGARGWEVHREGADHYTGNLSGPGWHPIRTFMGGNVGESLRLFNENGHGMTSTSPVLSVETIPDEPEAGGN